MSSETADLLPGAGLDRATAVKVLHQRDVMTCESFELDSIETFANAWLQPLRS